MSTQYKTYPNIRLKAFSEETHTAGETRTEKDTMGSVEVPHKHFWGAQTQRSLKFFSISNETMPLELIYALCLVKRSAAKINQSLGLLASEKSLAIQEASDQVLGGLHDSEFPLSVWQTGSGTQTNMNLNEVLANLASEIMGGKRGTSRLVHANDDVNLGQSSNDVFPTAMHVAALVSLKYFFLSVNEMMNTCLTKSTEFKNIIKIGRTHLQDATPLTLGQEISGWYAQLEIAKKSILDSQHALEELAIGGTAVGTGLNSHPQFGNKVAAELAECTGIPFRTAKNSFAALSGHEPIVALHGSLKAMATALIKIANDIRWLASGPRSGLGELYIPENEPGSSIMPGKVNPTQCEAITMLCAQVIGNDTSIAIGAASGNFELNVFKPLIINALLQSIRLLTDGIKSFNQHCLSGITVNKKRVQFLVDQSLMLVTALTPHIGYDKAAAIAKTAHREEKTLREAALESGYVTGENFDKWVRPQDMVGENII